MELVPPDDNAPGGDGKRARCKKAILLVALGHLMSVHYRYLSPRCGSSRHEAFLPSSRRLTRRHRTRLFSCADACGRISTTSRQIFAATGHEGDTEKLEGAAAPGRARTVESGAVPRCGRVGSRSTRVHSGGDGGQVVRLRGGRPALLPP